MNNKAGASVSVLLAGLFLVGYGMTTESRERTARDEMSLRYFVHDTLRPFLDSVAHQVCRDRPQSGRPLKAKVSWLCPSNTNAADQAHPAPGDGKNPGDSLKAIDSMRHND